MRSSINIVHWRTSRSGDRLLPDGEVSALSYNVGDNVSGEGKRLTNIAMYALLVVARVPTPLPVAGPVLAVFAAAATIISGEAFTDENADNIRNLEHAMVRGINKLRDDMNQKFLDLEHYVDASIQCSNQICRYTFFYYSNPKYSDVRSLHCTYGFKITPACGVAINKMFS